MVLALFNGQISIKELHANMTISGTNVCFSIEGARSSSQMLILENLCHGSSIFCDYGNIWDKFHYSIVGPRSRSLLHMAGHLLPLVIF